MNEGQETGSERPGTRQGTVHTGRLAVQTSCFYPITALSCPDRTLPGPAVPPSSACQVLTAAPGHQPSTQPLSLWFGKRPLTADLRGSPKPLPLPLLCLLEGPVLFWSLEN